MGLLLKRFVVCIIAIVPLISFSQEIPLYSHYYMNPYLYNPSYAGSEGKSALFLTHRRQWVGVEGAPVTSNISFHSPLSKGLSLGLNLNNDQRSILSTTNFLVTFAYHVKLAYNQDLRFGISAGAGFNSTDVNALNDIIADTGDPALINLLDNNIYLEGNAGVSYTAGPVNVGFALPRLFNNKIFRTDSTGSFEVGEISPLDDWIAYANIRIFLSDRIVFEPRGFYRYSNDGFSQWEGVGVFHFMDAIWAGGSYRQDYGPSALAGVKLASGFAIGYNYGIGGAKDVGLSSATHEVQLGITFGKKEKKSSPRRRRGRRGRRPPSRSNSTNKADESTFVYSFIDTDRYLRPDEEIEEEPEIEVTAEPEPEPEPEPQPEPEPEPEPEPVPEPEPEEVVPVVVPVVVAEVVTEEEPEPEPEITPETEPEIVPEVQPDPVPVVPEPIIETQLENDEPIVVQRGTHLLEMQTGNYVVVGAFKSFDNAQEFSDRIFEQGHKASFGYLSNRGYYYVYVYEGQNATEARQERDRYRRNPQFKSAWHLQVQDGAAESASAPLPVVPTPAPVNETRSSRTEPETGNEMIIEKPNGNEPIVVQRGDHMLEMDAGHYAIVGAFTGFDNAQEYSDKLFELGYPASFGYLTEKNLYYVYLTEGNSPNEARTARDRLKKNRMFRDAWYLEVQN